MKYNSFDLNSKINLDIFRSSSKSLNLGPIFKVARPFDFCKTKNQHVFNITYKLSYLNINIFQFYKLKSYKRKKPNR